MNVTSCQNCIPLDDDQASCNETRYKVDPQVDAIVKVRTKSEPVDISYVLFEN